MESVRTYPLILYTGYHLYLFETLYVPNITRNLIHVSKLEVIGFSFKFGNGFLVCLNKNTFIIGPGILCDVLFKVNLDNLYVETLMTMNHNIGTKRSLVNEHSAFLWHNHLGHIS